MGIVEEAYNVRILGSGEQNIVLGRNEPMSKQCLHKKQYNN
jgi:hypothetical protein